MGLAHFMASRPGRWGRTVAGILLAVGGLGVIGGPVGWAIAVAGLLPITLGLMNGCILAPLLGVPFRGSDLQRR